MTEPADATPNRLRQPDWYRSATRWSQLTLVENDPGSFDPHYWIEAFRRTQSNAVCLSAGGYVAYYPSRLAHHHVSTHMGDGDPFGALVEGARALGMHVMARIDPHAIHDAEAKAHPEWVSVTADGAPRRHWAFPEAWVTCAYSTYNFDFVPQLVRELTETYDIDAIFANRWQGHGVCYCASCRQGFRDASGFELPARVDVEDPAWRAWAAWRRGVLGRLIGLLDDTVKAIRPHSSFIPNMGSDSLMEFDLGLIEAHCPFLCVDDQGRKGIQPIWAGGRNGKRIRATFRERPVVLIASVGPEEIYRWKDAVTTGPEIQSWLDNGTTHGMRPWYTKFNGTIADDRWLEPVVESFALHAQLEPVLTTTAPTAEIAILDPATTLRHHSEESRRLAEADDLGFYHALVEARLPFEMLSDEATTPELLDRFRVLVLANSMCLGEHQVGMLEAYVARGGAIVAGFETSTRTPDNRPHGTLALGPLFGARLTQPTRGPLKNTYVALDRAHPLTAGFAGARRIIGGTRVMSVEAAPDTEQPLLFVPDFPDLPMEEVYAREAPRGAAAVLRRHAGGGRTAYFPWNSTLR